jgi:hypothetical protein
MITGFETVDVNPLGPVQLYVNPELTVAVMVRFAPVHTGELPVIFTVFNKAPI